MSDSFVCPINDLALLVAQSLLRGQVRMRVSGWSMHPAIRDGEVVWMDPAVGAPLGVGQVVLYTSGGGRPIIHRVVGWRQVGGEQRLGIAADCPPGTSEWVSPAQVLGRVIAVERAGRRIALDGPLGWLSGWFWLLLRPLRPLLGRLRGWMRRLGGRARRA